MSVAVVTQALGGLALFLLAMSMMTDGLKVFAGSSLRRLLERSTATALRGVLTGVLVTGVVQSSSAVTVATIGFVNAGLLSLRQALGVVFGTNVGTTMTGWFVSLVGFGLKIEPFALPLLTVGVVVRMARGGRLRGLGEALAGFGLFFLGLAMLKDAFSAWADAQGEALAALRNAGPWAAIGAGFFATVVTQSSSAAIAILLTAATAGMLELEAAAAAVIGANVGTTSTALLAALRATPGAKRLAFGHILFNVGTGVVAVLVLPQLLAGIDAACRWLEVEGGAASRLAAFHTVFNVLGVLLMLPLVGPLSRLLGRLFRRAEEDLARPQHLDPTLLSTPALAVGALRAELRRLCASVADLAQRALAPGVGHALALAPAADAAKTLNAAVVDYVARVRAERMSDEVSIELARALRTSRYLGDAVARAAGALELRLRSGAAANHRVREPLEALLAAAVPCLELAREPKDDDRGDAPRDAALQRFLDAYAVCKAGLLDAAVARRVPVETTQELLDGISSVRRLVEQLVKADRLLRTPHAAAAIEVDAATS